MKTKIKQSTKTLKNSKDFYSFSTYKPNKNCTPIEYNGTKYLSKAQCMALEGITRKELDEYFVQQKVDEINTHIQELNEYTKTEL
jgi:uncharacterized radical SAM superfamily protein